MLTPTDYAYGTKRPPCETGYYETFNRDNMTLVDVPAAPIRSVTAKKIRTAAKEYDLANGYDGFEPSASRFDRRRRVELG